jgi:uncharacterized protein YndB with AHSA1/START domain
MKTPPAAHTTFAIDRHYPASPTRVFAAWARPEAKARWFVGPHGWKTLERALDFRVGGRELAKGAFPDGKVSLFEALYHDIVPEARIVYSYSMHVDGKLISVSLATVELEPAGDGTRLLFTEQAAFLNGFEDGGGRERGTRGLLDQLEASLQAG